MPAAPNLVDLEHAKSWAKRLLKTEPSLGTLSRCQEAVARMLGHANWHALGAFYTEKESEPEAESKGKSLDDMFKGVLSLINTDFPGIKAAQVEVLAHETEELNNGRGDFIDRYQELERDGYFPEAAMDMALDEHTQKIHAPPGHLMIRVRGVDGKAYLVVVDTESYQKAAGL